MISHGTHQPSGNEGVFYFCFPPGTNHGGGHRSAQLREALSTDGWTFREIPPARHSSRILDSILGVLINFRFGVFRPVTLSGIRSTGHLLTTLRRVIKDYPRVKTVFLEGTGFIMPFLFPLAKSLQLRVFSAPQNLESLVDYREKALGKVNIHERWRQEARLFSFCDETFCISQEEQWLLELFGLRASYLPYRPVEAEVTRLAEIRSKRVLPQNLNLLCLGSTQNIPTREGMIKLHEKLKGKLGSTPVTIHIVGNGTESLAGTITDPAFVLHGRVDDATLDRMRTECSALLIFQAATTGFLTRVTEALIAGIPVIGNASAVKSYRHLRGVYTFEDAEELIRILAGDLESPCEPQGPDLARFRRSFLGPDNQPMYTQGSN